MAFDNSGVRPRVKPLAGCTTRAVFVRVAELFDGVRRIPARPLQGRKYELDENGRGGPSH